MHCGAEVIESSTNKQHHHSGDPLNQTTHLKHKKTNFYGRDLWFVWITPYFGAFVKKEGPPFPSEKAFVLFHPKRRKKKLSSGVEDTKLSTNKQHSLSLTCASSKEADAIANARAWHLRRAGATRHTLDQPASPLRLERLCSGASMHMDVSMACTSLCLCFISSTSTRSLSRSWFKSWISSHFIHSSKIWLWAYGLKAQIYVEHQITLFMGLKNPIMGLWAQL